MKATIQATVYCDRCSATVEVKIPLAILHIDQPNDLEFTGHGLLVSPNPSEKPEGWGMLPGSDGMYGPAVCPECLDQ